MICFYGYNILSFLSLTIRERAENKTSYFIQLINQAINLKLIKWFALDLLYLFINTSLCSKVDNRYAFTVDWYDAQASLVRKYQLLFYPIDGSIELVCTYFI
jgi:hypothetical protein